MNDVFVPRRCSSAERMMWITPDRIFLRQQQSETVQHAPDGLGPHGVGLISTARQGSIRVSESRLNRAGRRHTNPKAQADDLQLR